MTNLSDIECDDDDDEINDLNSQHIDLNTIKTEMIEKEFDDEEDDEDENESSSDSDYMDDDDDDGVEDGDFDQDKDRDCERKIETLPSKQIYVPNVTKLTAEDDTEKLECDYSAYVVYHKAETGFPCLSFDIIEDHFGSGDQRAQDFPLSCYLVAGTQADKDHLNRLMVLKFFNMHSVSKKSNDDDEDNDDCEDEEEEIVPDLNCSSIPHPGCVNRVRVKRIDDKVIAASWSEHGSVHLWDITNALNSSEDYKSSKEFTKQNVKTRPLFSFNGHRSQGYGLDWSSVEDGTLASGGNKHIFIWKPSNHGWYVDQPPLIGHEDSVEDIQWSPNESNILGSCSIDRSVRIWDIRNRKQSALIIPESHQSDVNVISWNHVEKAFIISGGDDGVIKIWDLRQVRRKLDPNGSSSAKPVAVFKQHHGPITSVDWHKTDGTVFAASSEDHQITQWDLAVEKDDDVHSSNVKEKNDHSQADEQEKIVRQLPPQLLFIHQGQKEIKEIHWHKQIPGLLISTASTGFDIFRTVSV
ncbi:Glutamate-rich WD repeat-containing protein 1 [Sarcoptes scabiei]|uniref:Glutamate-rich WD repeat-containing protein 1 n=1 Tax=Sarcoptes scabiei TaxID=52283 RepID=A0A834VHV4_SARSC|nr:Glutamate-rich WD repeat-containing protein 1 [Sarcoptes scabiei]